MLNVRSEYIITLLISALIGYLLYLVMLPFMVPIFWAVVFVILFHPYYRWLQKHVSHKKSTASLLACFTIALFLIIPLALMGTALANEMLNVYQWAENYMKTMSGRTPKTPVFFITYLQKLLSNFIDISASEIQNIIAEAIKQISAFIAEGLKGFIKNFAIFIINLLLTFITMYFLFKDGDKLFEIVKDIVPLSESYKKKIIKKNRLVISATMNGGLVVGAVQGLLGGMAFWFLGLSAPLLWGFVMLLLSFIPSVGTALVWGPAVIYLLIKGLYLKAIILFLWGTFIVGIADNLLRPVIVSGRTNMHPLLLFFSILGAVNAFGIIGIIAGPIILSVGQAMVEIYHDTIKNKNTWAG